MSDSKKYYYLKLKEDFFNSDSMMLLEGMPNGYLYSNILLKLYLRSLHAEGRLMFNDRIPFNTKMLASITRHDEETVKAALEVLTGMGLVEVLDSGAIYMTDIQNFIGKSSSEGDRKRAMRARIDSEKRGVGQMSGQTSAIRPPEIESEIKSEIEPEKKIESEIESESDTDTSDAATPKVSETCRHLVDNTPTQYRSGQIRSEKYSIDKSQSRVREESDTDTDVSDASSFSSSQFSLRDLIKRYEDNVLGHKSSNQEQAAFMMLYEQYGDKQLREAITTAALNNAGGINYIKTVLSNGSSYSPDKWRAEHGQ
jgi:predicted phage replisome organizer